MALDGNPGGIDELYVPYPTLQIRAGEVIGLVTVGFAQRDEQDKSIEAMGHVEGADEDGFDFIRTW